MNKLSFDQIRKIVAWALLQGDNLSAAIAKAKEAAALFKNMLDTFPGFGAGCPMTEDELVEALQSCPEICDANCDGFGAAGDRIRNLIKLLSDNLDEATIAFLLKLLLPVIL